MVWIRPLVLGLALLGSIQVDKPALVIEVVSNDQLWRGARLSLVGPTGEESTTATTDRQGRAFFRALPEGKHIVRLRDPRVPFHWERTVDTSVTDGFLTWTVPTEPVQIRVLTTAKNADVLIADASRTVMVKVASRGDGQVLSDLRLPSGTYVVAARDSDGTSEAISVEVGSSGRIHQLFLRTIANDPVLRVEMSDKVRRDSAIVGMGAVGRRIGEGVFSLKGFVWGTSAIALTPGLAPACVTIDGRDLNVAPQPKREVEMWVPTHGSVPAGTLLDVPGSNCGVDLRFFDYTPLSPIEGRSRFLVRDFPVASKMRWRYKGEDVAVPDGERVLKLSKN